MNAALMLLLLAVASGSTAPCPPDVTGKRPSVEEPNGAPKRHLADEAPDLRGRARAQEPSATTSAALAPLVGEVISPDAPRAFATRASRNVEDGECSS